MKFSAILVTLASVAILGGCDNILGLDNRDAPSSVLTGRVMFEGQPVGVRSNEVQLELWEPRYQDQLYQKIPIHLNQDGTFKSALFDGDYKLNLLPNNGPWLNDPDTTFVELRGQASVDLEVVPYFVIRDPVITRNPPADPTQGGSITATFRVEAVAPANPQRPVELVGLYLSTTTFADRNINPVPLSPSITPAIRERTRAQIQTQLNTNGTITIVVPLPNTVYETQSPVRRTSLFGRIGVKTLGVGQMLYTPVVEIAL